MSDLVDWWRPCDLEHAPFIHERDKAILEDKIFSNLVDLEPRNFEDFVHGAAFGDFGNKRLHLSLLPNPYNGHLATANIFVLLLNPGAHILDYYAEYKAPEVRKALIGNIKQELYGAEFPFIWLNPQYCFHGGFLYWEEKFRGIATEWARVNQRSYITALMELSRRVACLQLIPYHSIGFSAHSLIDRLPSTQIMREFVDQTLIPDALLGKKLLIVTRRVDDWAKKIPQCKNIVTYKGGLSRGAHLGPATPGGEAILRFLRDINKPL